MASSPNFRISTGTPFGPSDLFFPLFANLFLITLVFIIKVSPELASCIFGMFDRSKRRMQIGIKDVRFFSSVRNDRSVVVFYRRSNSLFPFRFSHTCRTQTSSCLHFLALTAKMFPVHFLFMGYTASSSLDSIFIYTLYRCPNFLLYTLPTFTLNHFTSIL